MLHEEHASIVFEFGVSGVVGDFLTCGSRLTSFLFALLFAVANLTTVVASNELDLPTMFGKKSPPSSIGSSSISIFLLRGHVTFMIPPGSSSSALAELATSASTTF